MQTIRIAAVLFLLIVPGFGQDWSAQKTANYLDSRQKEWFEWPTAKTPDGPCVSCHTGWTYLLARPQLRGQLGETSPTPYETGLIEGMRARVRRKNADDLAKTPTQALGVEAIMSALFLSRGEQDNLTLSTETQRAFDQLWALQIREGKDRGAWPWFSLELDPWEMPESTFFGATVAAQAIANTPLEYRRMPEIKERVNLLAQYARRELPSQPLHNRIALLWASSKLTGLIPASEQQAIVKEALAKQQADGGWTIESLGPWAEHVKAPTSTGSRSYATAFVTFVLEQAGVTKSNRGLTRALEWLKSHQDHDLGTWRDVSLNKVFEPDSMQIRFMQDAATAFAALALSLSDQGVLLK